MVWHSTTEVFRQESSFQLLSQVPHISNMLDNTVSLISTCENPNYISVNRTDLQFALIPRSPSSPPNHVLYTHLNLSASNLEAFESLSTLERLKVLDISKNCIKILPDICKSMRTLTYVDVSHNSLSKFPEWILQLENAKTIKLGHNPIIKTFHSHLMRANWKMVEVCYLENLNLCSIPECLLNSRYLQHFAFGSATQDKNCESNHLWTIPKRLPVSITGLDLSCIKLSSLDHNWQAHSKLKRIIVEGNDLAWIPDEFLLLSGLEECNLSSCGLFLLPKRMENLIGLQVLNLSFNMLTTIPKSIELLVHLQHLDLYGNKVDTVLCDFQLLKCLKGCDLWLNCIDPSQYLPAHHKLCKQLRKEFHCEDRSCTQEVMESDVEEVRSNTEDQSDESSWSDQNDCDTGLDTAPVDPRDIEVPILDSGNNDLYEEPWDEQFDCLTVPTPTDQYAVRTQADCFCPSVSHAVTHVLSPNVFPVVPGQFDDE